MTLIDRAQKVADLRHTSVRKLAIEAGIGENAPYRWDKTNPGIATVAAYAKAGNVSLDYMYERTDNPFLDGEMPEVDLNKDDSLSMLSFDGMDLSPEYADELRRYAQTQIAMGNWKLDKDGNRE